MHICVSKLTIIGSDNGLSPDWRQSSISTDPGILLIGPLGTIFTGILIEMHILSFQKIHLKMSSGKWRPFCLGINVFNAFFSWELRCFSSKKNGKVGDLAYNTTSRSQSSYVSQFCNTIYKFQTVLIVKIHHGNLIEFWEAINADFQLDPCQIWIIVKCPHLTSVNHYIKLAIYYIYHIYTSVSTWWAFKTAFSSGRCG